MNKTQKRVCLITKSRLVFEGFITGYLIDRGEDHASQILRSEFVWVYSDEVKLPEIKGFKILDLQKFDPDELQRILEKIYRKLKDANNRTN